MVIKTSLSTQPIAEVAEQGESYDRWFRAKIEAAINSEKPRVPHEQVMNEMQIRLAAKKKIRKME
ncbi:hypothetical protein D4100_18570 [Serratia inhibens]|uniref:Stability determinant domain-containing protein n=1 Tax=Serratia inhibens TaxID=2338073 RepID=A0AA92X540_9GAMM|nr:hypothetical protein [Serratia inhibens]RJF54490.1 hypothetical protein D4100_18570 [Serratia inhibens]